MQLVFQKLHKSIKALPNLEQTFIYTDILKFDNTKLQSLANWIIDRVKIEIQSSSEIKTEDLITLDCKYISEHIIYIPVWYLQMQGHNLEKILKKLFPELNRFHRESALKLEILSKVVDDLPNLLSKDFVNLFLEIQENQFCY